ncbi:MAG: hypothetical protein CH6_1263 [Candidatus Kapaibacterium sp.]|nr:MAG: hypothetical protein CH6_1263 [Candidatus Kapabacteria bacterium]
MIARMLNLFDTNIQQIGSRKSDFKANLSQSKNLEDNFGDLLSQILHSIFGQSLNLSIENNSIDVEKTSMHRDNLIEPNPSKERNNLSREILGTKLKRDYALQGTNNNSRVDSNNENLVLNSEIQKTETKELPKVALEAKIRINKAEQNGNSRNQLAEHFPLEEGILDRVILVGREEKSEEGSSEVEKGKVRKEKAEQVKGNIRYDWIKGKEEVEKRIGIDSNKVGKIESKRENGEDGVTKIEQREKSRQENVEKWTKGEEKRTEIGAKTDAKTYVISGNQQIKSEGSNGVENQPILERSNSIRLLELPTKVVSLVQNAKEFPIKAEISLQPKWLGTVVVEISIVNDKVEIMFKAENKETLHTLENQASILKEKLNNNGFEKHSLVFNYQNEEKGASEWNFARGNNRQQDENLRREFLNSFTRLKTKNESFENYLWLNNGNQH